MLQLWLWLGQISAGWPFWPAGISPLWLRRVASRGPAGRAALLGLASSWGDCWICGHRYSPAVCDPRSESPRLDMPLEAGKGCSETLWQVEEGTGGTDHFIYTPTCSGTSGLRFLQPPRQLGPLWPLDEALKGKTAHCCLLLDTVTCRPCLPSCSLCPQFFFFFL